MSVSQATISTRMDGRIIGFYVAAFAAGGVIQPFLNLYLNEIGLSGTQIGVLQGWTALATVLITPFIGVLADRSQRHRLILSIIVALKGFSAPLMLLSNAWLWLLGAVSLRMLTAPAQDAIMNRLTLAELDQRGTANLGAVRFWGALSYAATSLLTGWLATGASVAVLFPLAGLLGLVAAMLARGFPAQIAPRLRPGQHRALPRRSSALWLVFAVSFLFTLSQTGPRTFAFVYLVESLHADHALIGRLGALGSLAPLLALPLADRINLKRGPVLTMGVGLACSGLAWAGYLLIQGPGWAAPLVFLENGGASLVLLSMVLLLGRHGIAERATTDQMLGQLTIPGLARMLAEPSNGWIFERIGGHGMFAANMVFVLLAILLLVIVRKPLSQPPRITLIEVA